MLFPGPPATLTDGISYQSGTFRAISAPARTVFGGASGLATRTAKRRVMTNSILSKPTSLADPIFRVIAAHRAALKRLSATFVNADRNPHFFGGTEKMAQDLR
jgi:hypothetical protein